MGSIADVEHRILELEQQVARLTRQIQDLKATRNSFSPLVRLPDELLLEVTQHVAPRRYIVRLH
jgi:hypothetical protein